MNVEFTELETGGFSPATMGMRLPTKSIGDSFFDGGKFVLGEKDERLAKSLIAKGNTHAKFQRGIIAWFKIDMPLSIWAELDTYTVGMAPVSSESTMYTLIKESADIDNGMFVDYTTERTIDSFQREIECLSDVYNGRKNIPIHVLKSALPSGWLQKRIRAFSYQSLKGLYYSRKFHRMPEWEVICNAIEQLPLFEELLIGCKKNDFKFEMGPKNEM